MTEIEMEKDDMSFTCRGCTYDCVLISKSIKKPIICPFQQISVIWK